MEKVHFDLFQCVALGLKAAIWPSILALPVVVVFWAIHLGPLAFGDPVYDNYLISQIAGTIIYVFCALMFPIAMIHMSMPYTYKAWLPVNMAVIFFRVAGPALYWFVLFLAAILPVGVALTIVQFVWDGGLAGFVFDMHTSTFEFLDWFVETVGIWVPKNPMNARAWYVVFILYSVALIPIAVAVTPFCMIFAFSGVFLMRANAYIALYFRDKLDLVEEQKPGVLCGFGPRYVAYLVDYLVINVFLLIIFLTQHYAGVFFTNLGIDYLSRVLLGAYGIASFVIPWLYFARPQSASSVRASIGKHSVGIVVTKENGDTMNFGEATGRYFVNTFVSKLLLGIGCFMVAFTDKKEALHDMMLKTKVVWLGDDERKLYE